MAGETEPEKKEGKGSSGEAAGNESAWTGLLKSAAKELVPVLLTAGSLIGFVAFAGAVIVWTRLYAIQVPPEQAVKAVPRDELVATGSSLLLLFGFFGVLAIVGAYLIDRGGRATTGMSRALLVLLAIEGGTAIRIFDDGWHTETTIAIVVFILLVLAALLVTFLEPLARYVDVLPARPEESMDAVRGRGPLRTADNKLRIPISELRRPAGLLAAVLGLVAILLFAGFPLCLDIGLLIVLGCAVFVLARSLWGIGGEIAGSLKKEWAEQRKRQTEEQEQREKDRLDRERAERERLRKCAETAGADSKGEGTRLQRACGRLVKLLSAARGKEVVKRPQESKEDLEEKRKLACEEEREKARMVRRRPNRLVMTWAGTALLSVLAAFAILVPCLVLDTPWIAVPLGVAMVLGLGVWRIAVLSKKAFMWYGFAVFLSVPLFGTFTLMAHNVAFPQVQPLAMIRSTDGPAESIQGIYVTEGSDRVYFANVATEGCENEVKKDSGRLLWVPKDDVVAMSIGPLQDVNAAGKAALEMAYALTPAVETPAGDRVSLSTAEERFAQAAGGADPLAAEPAAADPGVSAGDAGTDPEASAADTEDSDEPADDDTEEPTSEGDGEEEGEATPLVQRLEDPGPAVRPSFGSGLTLVPETASPGDLVELRLSVPNEDVEGFGSSPNGHTLRVGGVPVSILRIGTRQAFDAEYVKTADGKVLSLDKQGVYGLSEVEEPELLEKGTGYAGERYIKLEDSTVEEVEGGGLEDHSEYLRVVGNESFVKLAGSPKVRLAGANEFVALDRRLRRQAWETDRIRFRVPENASTGVVTVECGQLAGQPLLRVSRPPIARIAVQMETGTGRVGFDGRRSSDDGRIVSRRWTIGGLPRGKEAEISRRLRPRLAAYRVQLTVTDEDGETDVAELHLLRLPLPSFRFADELPEDRDLLGRIRRAVALAARDDPPAAIEIDGHADDIGSRSYNLNLSWQRAVNVRKALRATSLATISATAPQPVGLKIRAFGESCPIDPGGGRSRRNRRVEVFILGSDTRVVVPRGCRAGRVGRTTW